MTNAPKVTRARVNGPLWNLPAVAVAFSIDDVAAMVRSKVMRAHISTSARQEMIKAWGSTLPQTG